MSSITKCSISKHSQLSDTCILNGGSKPVFTISIRPQAHHFKPLLSAEQAGGALVQATQIAFAVLTDWDHAVRVDRIGIAHHTGHLDGAKMLARFSRQRYAFLSTALQAAQRLFKLNRSKGSAQPLFSGNGGFVFTGLDRVAKRCRSERIGMCHVAARQRWHTAYMEGMDNGKLRSQSRQNGLPSNQESIYRTDTPHTTTSTPIWDRLAL